MINPPLNILFLIGNRCNSRCIMCDIWKAKNVKEEKYERIRKIMDEISSLGVKNVTFTGGEPFLRKDIFRIVNYASGNGLNTAIVTNGTLINKIIANQIIKSGLNSIYFSIDGTRDIDDMIRGKKGMFDKTINNMKNLINIKDEKLRVCVISVLMNQNLEDIMNLVELIKKMNVDGFVMQPIHLQKGESAFSIESDKNYLSIPKSMYGKIDKVMDNLMELKRKNLNLIENSITYLELARRFLKNERLNFKCFAGFSFCGIDAEGNVYPCLYRKSVGNIFDSSLRKIWNSNLYNKTRNKMKSCNKCLLLCHHRFLLDEKEQSN